LAKVQAKLDYQRRLQDDPESILGPMAEHKAELKVRAALADYQRQQLAGSVLRQHEGWLFVNDPAGRPLVGADGKRQLSPEGRIYAQALDRLGRSGVTDPAELNEFALAQVYATLVQHHLQQAQAQAGQAGQAGQAAPAVAAAQHRPAVSPAVPPAAQPNGQARPRPDGQGQNLRELLAARTSGMGDDVSF
jgi:hypothetical protein